MDELNKLERREKAKERKEKIEKEKNKEKEETEKEVEKIIRETNQWDLKMSQEEEENMEGDDSIIKRTRSETLSDNEKSITNENKRNKK